MANQLNDKEPIYIQVRNFIENMIITHQLEEGDQTPSTTEIAKFYKINHITVGKGVNQLVDEGVLYKKRGIGMFVAEGARETLLNKRRTDFVVDYIQPLIKEAKNLSLSQAELVEMINNEISMERE